MSERSVVVAVDPGIQYAGLVAFDVAGGIQNARIIDCKVVASPGKDGGRKSHDSMRRVAEQALALLEFLRHHQARVLVAEVSDEGARSAAAAAGMAYARAMLAVLVALQPNLPYVWVTPNESRNAVIPEDERRAIREQAKTVVLKKGKNAGKKKPGAMSSLLKEAVVRHVRQLHDGALDDFSTDREIEALADAIATFHAAKASPIVRMAAAPAGELV